MTRIFITVTDEDKERLKDAALDAGINMSDYVRVSCGLTAIRQGIKTAEPKKKTK